MEIQVASAVGYDDGRRDRRADAAVRVCLPCDEESRKWCSERRYPVRDRRGVLLVRADKLRNHEPVPRMYRPPLYDELSEGCRASEE